MGTELSFSPLPSLSCTVMNAAMMVSGLESSTGLLTLQLLQLRALLLYLLDEIIIIHDNHVQLMTELVVVY